MRMRHPWPRGLWCIGLAGLSFLAFAPRAWAQAPATAPGAKTPPTALDRYQDCFQKMVDAGATDNAFMRRCLGLEPKEAPEKGAEKGKGLSVADAETVAKAGLPGVQACYARLLAQTKELGLIPEGLVEARLEVLPNGGVEGVAFEPGSLTDVNLLACLKSSLAAWRFPKANVSERASVTVGFRLEARGERTPQVSLSKGSLRVEALPTGYTAEEVLTVFRKNAHTVRRCYDELLKRQPEASGTGAAELVVGPRGRVRKVSFRDLKVGDAAFKGCLIQEIRRWRFPKPPGDQATEVKFPPLRFGPR